MRLTRELDEEERRQWVAVPVGREAVAPVANHGFETAAVVCITDIGLALHGTAPDQMHRLSGPPALLIEVECRQEDGVQYSCRLCVPDTK